MSHRNLRALCEGAIMVALAQLLGYLKLYSMPYGGSITFVMLPIFVYCARWGLSRGLMASFALGILQLVLDRAYGIAWYSFLGDYIFAYGLLGLAGIFHKQKFGFFYGTLLGSFARFAVAWVLGALAYAEATPTNSVFGIDNLGPWVYSLIYNGSYIFASMLLCLVVGLVAYKPLGKFLRGEDIR